MEISMGNKVTHATVLLDYAYIGARYDREYKITKEQLEQLG